MKTKKQQIRETILKDNPGMRPKIEEQMIQNMAKSFQTLKTRACDICAADSMLLVPVVLRVCRCCATKMGKRTGKLNIIDIDIQIYGYSCDWCGARTNRVTVINPEICERCMVKFGKAVQKEKDRKY